MTGYFDDPDQTAEALADGWYHSGASNLAVRTPTATSSCATAEDISRLRAGENISTIEVEQAISQHPRWWQPSPRGVHAGREMGRATQGLRRARRRRGRLRGRHSAVRQKSTLSGYMRPAAVEIAELPKTSTGKIQKKELRDKDGRATSGESASGRPAVAILAVSGAQVRIVSLPFSVR